MPAIFPSEMNTEASEQLYFADVPLEDLVDSYYSTVAEREAEYKIMESFDRTDVGVHLVDHVASVSFYSPKDISMKSFRDSSEVQAFFGPLVAANDAFGADRLRLLQAVTEYRNERHQAKANAGFFQAEASYDLLSERLDVLERHICSLPCRSIEDVDQKVRFALFECNRDDMDWVARDEILKSIFRFTQFQSCEPDHSNLQVAALKTTAEQLSSE